MAGQAMQLSETKLNAFMERAVGDMGAAMHAALIVIGDKLGLYKAMAGAGVDDIGRSWQRKPRRLNGTCANG